MPWLLPLAVLLVALVGLLPLPAPWGRVLYAVAAVLAGVALVLVLA